ncbi:helicase [Alteromonas sp. a30]|nr:helicase [Alteromonas sp. a30]
MNAKLNGSGGRWYKLETRWKGVLVGGGKVKVKINPVYSGTSKRPTEFEVTFSVNNGPVQKQKIKNTPTGN